MYNRTCPSNKKYLWGRNIYGPEIFMGQSVGSLVECSLCGDSVDPVLQAVRCVQTCL